MSTPLNIVGLGAVTPVGLDARQTCAAVRAGLTAFETNHCSDRARGPTIRAEVPLRPRPNNADPFDRLVAIAAVALKECLLSARVDASRCSLLLCVRRSDERLGVKGWSGAELLDAIRARRGLDFGQHCEVISAGKAGAMHGLLRARQLLSERRTSICVVGGVDTLHTLADTRSLSHQYRLKSDAVAKGLIPGEGAAFVALTLDASGQSLAKILGIGLGREDASTTVQSGSHPSGYGLEEAIRAALEDARVPESGLHFRVSDLNGESYGAYETMLASSRVYQTRRERFPLRLAAASVGETGAAAGALSIVLAAMAIRLGYAGGTVGICEASSDESYRGACIVGQGDMLSPVRDQSDISRVVSALENPPIRSIAIQHVGQAALLRYGRTRLVRATHVGLLHLGRLDERINAHLDGISASGPYGASQVRAALANPQAGELFVATVCAIEDGQLARLDELIEIAHAIPESWRGVLSGFGWVPSTHLRGITRALLEGARPWQREVGLVACRLHGVDPGRALERALGDTDRELRLCALRTAGRCGRLDLLDACMDGLAADDVRVALEAAHSALLLGDRNESLDKLESLAMMTSETDCLNLAALRVLFKVISPNRARSVLAAVARDPKRMRVLLGGVSVCGDPYYVPWLIAQMWDPKVSRLAGEAFSSIAGIDLALSRLDRASPPDGIAVGPTNSPDDDNVAIDEDDTLPWPDPERINAWWKSNGHRFMAGTSYFMGDLATPAKCLQVLKTGLQRQRTAAAEYLTLFTPGRPVFNTAAPAWRQGRLLATMPE